MATLIVITILIIVADNIIDGMIHAKMARNIIKTALGLGYASVCWLGWCDCTHGLWRGSV